MSKKKFYVVVKGRQVGIYSTWDETKTLISGYSGAVYRSFTNLSEAQKYFIENTTDKNPDLEIKKVSKVNKEPKGIHVPGSKDIQGSSDIKNYLLQLNKLEREDTIVDSNMDSDTLYAYVDGSYYNGTAGYGLVLVKNNTVIVKDMSSFRGVNFNEQRNVFGELRGAMKAVELALANSCRKLCIVYDYEGIEKFSNGQWKGKKGCTADYTFFMDKYTKILDISFKKVKAHATNKEDRSKYNEMADLLAKMSVRL